MPFEGVFCVEDATEFMTRMMWFKQSGVQVTGDSTQLSQNFAGTGMRALKWGMPLSSPPAADSVISHQLFSRKPGTEASCEAMHSIAAVGAQLKHVLAPFGNEFEPKRTCAE